MRSISPFASTRSRSPSVTASIRGRQAEIARGVKAFETSLRKRVCLGGSVSSMNCPRSSAASSGPCPGSLPSVRRMPAPLRRSIRRQSS